MKKETLLEIGESIQQHSNNERANKDISIYAVGRVSGYITSSRPQVGIPNGYTTFWLTNDSQRERGIVYRGDGFPIWKNTKMGEVLTKYYQGKHSYSTPTNTKKENNVDIKIFNKAIFSNKNESVSDVTIRLAGKKTIYSYQNISDLLEEQKKLESRLQELEDLKKKEEESRRLEELWKDEENKRLEEQRKKEEEQRIRNEIEQLEKEIAESEAKIRQAKSFIRSTVALREQPLLDEYQETAKRSHLYDGIPIVIEGGPGTGKTTTVIQRLKFLTTQEVLDEYEVPISEAQKKIVSDVNHKSWMFVSPTKLLLQYLRQNMQYEGLTTTEENTTVIDDFRIKMIREYCLRKPDTDGPFKIYKMDGKYRKLILKPQEIINKFEKYIVQQITKNLSEVAKLETKSYSWHDKAVRIKSYCAKAKEIKDLNALLDLFYSLQENEESHVNELVDRSREKVKEISAFIRDKIKSEPETIDKLKILFDKWRKDRITEDEININYHHYFVVML